MLASDKVMTVPGFKTQSWMTARMAIWCNLWSQQWSWLFWGSLSFQLCGVLFEAAISVNLVFSLSSQLSSGARYLVIRHMSSMMPMLKTNNRDQTKQRKQSNQSDQSLSSGDVYQNTESALVSKKCCKIFRCLRNRSVVNIMDRPSNADRRWLWDNWSKVQ